MSGVLDAWLLVSCKALEDFERHLGLSLAGGAEHVKNCNYFRAGLCRVLLFLSPDSRKPPFGMRRSGIPPFYCFTVLNLGFSSFVRRESSSEPKHTTPLK